MKLIFKVSMNFNALFSLFLGCFLLMNTVQAIENLEPDSQKHLGLANQECTSCHKQVEHDWQQSDHAKSMAIANKTSVLANFDNVNVEHYGQKANFFIKDNHYQVTISYDGKTDTYPIKYTFGYFPLQQYLVETEKGRLQVLPFAWDSRDKTQGGQHWYHNYSHEEVRPEDRLHWRQPLQNWNGMCADCHSDGLVRNYNAEKNTFNSQFDNINVGCLSCHNNMSTHEKVSAKRNVSADITSKSHPTGQWLRSINEKTAHWQGDERDNTFMDNCFACHSLRSPITDGFKANKAFLDQYTPQLPIAPFYYADGQIKEEVYVYGSFLQSKMFAAGVNCLDCHDKHTMKLKVESNGLCLQCHSGQSYNVTEHHQHDENSSGAQCVNCHMPENRYMGVDDRRDHSFKIPRPDISQTYGTPNACIKCHDEKSNQWASNILSQWHGKPKSLTSSKQYLLAINSGQSINLKDHLSIINDTHIDVISRASAIELLGYTTQAITAEVLKPYLTHKEALIRLSAARTATLLPPTDKVSLLVPLLKDKYKAIRIAAARSLLDSHISAIDKTAFYSAFKELQYANEVSSWRGEGRLNQGVNALQSNDVKTAVQAFKTAINIEPYFEPGYINLADLYRSLQQPKQVKLVLIKGMKAIPKSGAIKYAYGLHLVREKKHTEAVTFFKEAMLLSPANTQYAYTFILAMDGAGMGAQALVTLKSFILNYPDKIQLRELGLYLSQKLNSKVDYDWFMAL